MSTEIKPNKLQKVVLAGATLMLLMASQQARAEGFNPRVFIQNITSFLSDDLTSLFSALGLIGAIGAGIFGAFIVVRVQQGNPPQRIEQPYVAAGISFLVSFLLFAMTGPDFLEGGLQAFQQ